MCGKAPLSAIHRRSFPSLKINLFFLKRFTSAWRTALRAPSRPPGILRTPTRQYTRGRRLSCPSPGTPRENCAYVPARTQTRAAPFQSCAHVRLPCAGAPWPSRAARTSCAPLAPPEAAAYPLTPRRAHLTSTPAPFCALCRLCRLLLASHKRLYQDAPRVRRRSGTAQARTHARTRARARARASALCCTDCQPAHTAYSTMCTHTPDDAARTPQQ